MADSPTTLAFHALPADIQSTCLSSVSKGPLSYVETLLLVGREIQAERERRRVVEITDDVVSYIARYGGRCRQCADEDGVCPHSGLPCGASEKAIRHVLTALNYGVANGFLPSPPVGGDE